jgi:hypothetical protein
MLAKGPDLGRAERLREPFSAMCETCPKLWRFRVESVFARLYGPLPLMQE